jgi:resuscitation-promoting factor RpfB
VQQATKRRLVIGAQGVALGVITVGAVGFVSADKTVELTVDGQSRSVQTFGNDVAAVLRAADITVDEHDDVSPSLDSPVSRGSVVTVQLAREVQLNVDGTQRTVETTARTVGELAGELGLEDGSKLSLAEDLSLASASAPLSVTTPKALTLLSGGKSTAFTSTALDVRAALKARGITPDEDDEVSPALNTVLRDGLEIEYTKVEHKTKKVTSDVDYATTEVKDPTLAKGSTKVQTAGQAGERVQSYAVVLENGKEVSRKLTSDKVTKAAVDKVIRVGTKVEEEPAATDSTSSASSSSSAGTSAAGPSSGVWQKLAQCESGGNWGINTGNGYYGGLQFTAATWKAQGGTKYAPLPHQATPAQQIEIATKLQKRAGWGQWPACTSKLGLR